MYSRTSFGAFYPVDSSMHRLNPIVKLLCFILIIITICLTNLLYIHVALLISIFLMLLLSRVPFRYYFKTFWFFRYLYLLLVFVFYYLNFSLNDTLVYLSKIVIVLEYLNLFAYTTSPSESVYGIEKFLSFFNFLMLPISRLSIKINDLLRYIPNVSNIEIKAYKAASSRGIDYQNSTILGKIKIYLSFHNKVRRLLRYRNREVALCEELKLYNVNRYRTNYRINKIGFYDIVLLMFYVLLILIYLRNKGVI